MVTQAEQLHHGACPRPVCPSPAQWPQVCSDRRWVDDRPECWSSLVIVTSPRSKTSYRGRGASAPGDAAALGNRGARCSKCQIALCLQCTDVVRQLQEFANGLVRETALSHSLVQLTHVDG
jgi:hypothetical protein